MSETRLLYVRPSALMAAAYLCLCVRRGECSGWRLLFGRLHHPEWRRLTANPPCPRLVELAERDPRIVEELAVAHYRLTRGAVN